MASTKRKVSLTLDEELVKALEGDDGLSAQVNDALRHEVERRRRQQALGDLLARLDELDGPLDTADDAAEIARFTRLLGGTA